MADEEGLNSAAEKKKIKEDRKRLKQEEKQQRQEIKRRAKEIAQREAEVESEEEPPGSGVSSFFVTTVIVVIWIAILCFLIKLDVGHFASDYLTPLLKNVPVINKILPGEPADLETSDTGAYGGYSSLKEAVDYIHTLELELEHSQTVNGANTEELASLKKEVERLQEFEAMQVEFQRIKEQFYEEVIYADNGPGAEEYQKYFESMDPSTAEALYKQVVQKLEEDKEVAEWAQAYATMKPKQAAAIFESMTDDLNRVARILGAMDTDTRGAILGAMDASVAASLTKIMDPEG